MPNQHPITFVVPRDTPVSYCRGCGKPIYWIRTPRGKAMPVDTAADGGLTPMPDRDGRGVSHFATCPKANQFRRRQASAGARR